MTKCRPPMCGARETALEIAARQDYALAFGVGAP